MRQNTSNSLPFRGTSKGEIRALVSEALPRMIEDLERLESTGYSENVCDVVKKALDDIRVASINGAGSVWVAGIAHASGDFFLAYRRWNGQGEKTTRDAILQRRQEVDELRTHNNRMSADFRKNHLRDTVVTSQDAEFCDIAFDRLSNLSKSWPQHFKSLASAMKNRRRRIK